MAFVKAGIKEALMAAGGAAFPDKTGFSASPATIYGLGYSDKGTIEIAPFNEIKDKAEREFPNMLNVKAELNSMQMDPATMKFLLNCAANSSIAVKLITGKPVIGTDTITSPDGGIYSFDSADSLGIDIDLEITPKSRQNKITLQRAFKYSEPLPGFLTNASTATAPYVAGKLPMFNKNAVPIGLISPSFISIDDERLADFKVTIKTVSSANAFNRSIVSAISVSLEATLGNPNITELIAYLTHSYKGLVTLDIPLGATGTSDDLIINFAADGLTQSGKANLDDDKREVAVTLSGNYDIDMLTLDGSGITFNTYL